ncbi:hypothetical protein BSG1_03495 [Bacillus sp. SG-1]|nr:hypothetical protein BSG1_03495 [Bacillus sp. SG-1]
MEKGDKEDFEKVTESDGNHPAFSRCELVK